MKVSVIIPCRNEEKSISSVLTSLLKQELYDLKMEVIISDGESDDGTLEVVESFREEYAEHHINLHVLCNRKRNIPSALNLAVDESVGEFIVRVDAHSKFGSDYILKIVTSAVEGNYDVVGPSIENYSVADTDEANSIVTILNSPLGNGGTPSRNRIKTPKIVKHTVMSCYKRNVWVAIGGYDEKMLSNEDFEFDFRANEQGFSIVSLPSPVYYIQARKNIKEFAAQRFRYGFWKYKVFKKHPSSLHSRQVIPILMFFAILLGFLSPVFLLFQFILLFIVMEYIKLRAKSRVSRASLFLSLCVNYYVWSAGFLWSAFRNIWFERSDGK